jgi:hypothetical protein
MMEAIGLDKKVALIGILDRFEIWNPSSFRKIVLTDIARHEKFRKLRIAGRRRVLRKEKTGSKCDSVMPNQRGNRA